LIQKVYEVDPLICPKCQGEMRVISVIEDQAIIKKILQHLGRTSDRLFLVECWTSGRRQCPVALCLLCSQSDVNENGTECRFGVSCRQRIVGIGRRNPGRSSLIWNSVGDDRGVYWIVSERFFREYTPSNPLMAFGCFSLAVRK
jgi:hypothetical protein